MRVYVHPSLPFTSQGSTKTDNARITCTGGVLWSLLQGSQHSWLHACFVSSKTCCKLSAVLDTSEIPMYFVLWQDLHQLAAGLCCKAAANVLCLCWSWEQRRLRSPGGAWQLTNLNSFKQVLFPSTDWLNCPQATDNCLYKLN